VLVNKGLDRCGRQIEGGKIVMVVKERGDDGLNNPGVYEHSRALMITEGHNVWLRIG